MIERPIRIQRQRTKGWRMPEGAIYVGRPTRWGNPFPVTGPWIVWAAVAAGFRADAAGRQAASVFYFRTWLSEKAEPGPNAGSKGGGAITYESGLTLSGDDAARGMATVFANMHRIKVPAPPTGPEIREGLRGRSLACFCSLDKPCHADVLLEIANR